MYFSYCTRVVHIRILGQSAKKQVMLFCTVVHSKRDTL